MSAPAPPATAVGTGLYLHVPFCSQRCDYCDFNTYAGISEQIPRYVAALRRDLRRVSAAGPAALAPDGGDVAQGWPEITSVFVGGGTPTLLDPADLGGVLRLVDDVLPLADGVEVTVEANPETVTVDGMIALAEAGVNRVSMGAQSFTPDVLATLGRWHDPERPLAAVEQVRAAGIDRINLDLIYGTPGESDEQWHRTLVTALATGVEHVSAYALTVEANTAYARRVADGQALAPDDDVQAVRMAVADEVLTAAGLRRYELSNWARPGRECVHNLTYWRGGDWLGVGAGAHGHWRGRRWWSLRVPARYADAALAGRTTTAGSEVVTPDQARTERLLLGLRMVDGVPVEQVAPLDGAALERLGSAGLLEVDAGRLRLTSAGFAVANGVTVALL